MTNTLSIHYRRAALGEGTTAACGSIVDPWRNRSNVEEVTCKRCLKTIKTGSAESGYLAGSKLNEESKQAEPFEALLAQMAELTWIPLDARERFEAMLQQNFTGSINDDIIAEGDYTY